MEFTSRTVRSAPGLTQEEALNALQSHPKFRPGTRIASLRRRGDRWVADLLEPKTAEFPPSGGGDDEGGESKPSPSDEGGDDSESSDSPDDGGGGPPGLPGMEEGDPGEGEGGEGGTDKQILHVLTEILHALSGGPPGGGLGGPDDLGPGMEGPGGPPPHAGPGRPPGPAGGAPPMGAGGKLKPGEVPNHPGVTPVGAPAFASLQAKIAAVAGTKRQFKVAAPEGMSIKQTVASLNSAANPFGYKVEQVRRQQGRLYALVVKS